MLVCVYALWTQVCYVVANTHLYLLPHDIVSVVIMYSARPEETMWMIAQHKLNASDGAPQDIVDSIMSFNMSKPTDCTAYPEGSPTHPSWPAMHSAASSAAMWMGVVMNLTQAQWCEVKKMDWGVGTYK